MFVKKESRSSLLAVLFLMVFLADTASHAMICSNHTSDRAAFVSSTDAGRDDPCRAHIHCPENHRNERQLPGFVHDSMQHNALFDEPVHLIAQNIIGRDPQIPFGTANDLFRPPSPPFHPPEL